jgi:hypothetical protein
MMEAGSIEKTAFITHNELWEWTRMPFGLCNATSTFQRLMTHILAKLFSRWGNVVLCYVDDILIATATAEEHLVRLREVFECLRNAGLKLKAAKCKLMEKQIKFLGRLIDEEGIRPDPASVSKVLNWGTPDSRERVEHFIGFANYYREYIQDFAHLASPLNKLKGKNVEFVWDEAADNAYRVLVQKLTTAPILALPVDDQPYVLDTDASVVAISGILQQHQMRDGKMKLRVISYGSRGL